MEAVHRFTLILSLFLFAVDASAVTIVHTDDLEDGSTMGWSIGVSLSTATSVVPGGGLGRGANKYLQLTATGIPGSMGRLIALNGSSNWTGDYLGIAGITMDVNNFGRRDLFLRLLFEEHAGNRRPVNRALSADPVVVPANSGWHSVRFPINEASLLAPIGTVAGALAGADSLRILYNPDPVSAGSPDSPSVDAVLGVDKVTAMPEPRSFALLASGFGALLLRKRIFANR